MQFPSLLQAKTQPMDKEQSDMFMRLLIGETHGIIHTYTDVQADSFGVIGKILKGRLDLGQIEVSTATALWCILLSEGNPGNMVQWAWTLRELFVKKERCLVNLTDWTLAFPMGVPTEDERNRIWDLQKQSNAPAGNGLDRSEVWNVNTIRATSVNQPGDKNG